MITLKSPQEIDLIAQSAQLVSKTLGLMAERLRPGISTLELDGLAESFIRDHGGKPSFKGYNGYPNTLCMSVNEQIIHGIPNDKPLREGDIVSIDCGVVMNGFHGDHAFTFAIGEIDPEVRKLLDITRECLDLGIKEAIAGNRIGNIGEAVQRHAENHGFFVVREFVGHGIGRNLHEEPTVPNYGRRGTGKRMQEGMVLAIEPMINLGTTGTVELDDGWTVITADKLPSAHFEHDVAVLNGAPRVLSTFKYVEEALKNNPGIS